MTRITLAMCSGVVGFLSAAAYGGFTETWWLVVLLWATSVAAIHIVTPLINGEK